MTRPNTALSTPNRHDNKCPGCSGAGKAERIEFVWVRRCTGCGGVFTDEAITQEQAQRIVPNRFCLHDDKETRDVVKYYDLIVVGYHGNDRWHGWYHPGCGITQTG